MTEVLLLGGKDLNCECQIVASNYVYVWVSKCPALKLGLLKQETCTC